MSATAEKTFTISTPHKGVSAQKHNTREGNFKNQPHIDPNGEHIVLFNIPIRDFYEETFGEAVKEYNEKQTDDRRKIKNYYCQVENEERSKAKNAKHVSYEIVLQIGNKDHRPDEETCKKLFMEYYHQWAERNPNFRIYSANLHFDEATPHIHISYVPVSTQNKRGLSVQNSLSGALREMGFEKDGHRKNNPEKQWTDRERAFFETICRKYGLEIVHPMAGKGTKQLSVQAYKLTKDNEALERDLEKKQKTVSQLQSTADRQHNRAEKERLRADSEASRATEQIKLRETAKRDTEALEAKKEELHNYIEQKAAEAKQAHLKAVEEIINIEKSATVLKNTRDRVRDLAHKMSTIEVFGTPEEQELLKKIEKIIDETSEKNSYSYDRTFDRSDDREADRFDDDTDFLPG